jgi:trigger factor
MMQGSPVSFEFEEVSPVEKRLKVEVAKEQVNAKLEEAFRQMNRSVNLRGFRKGHAPRSLLESMFGKKVGADTARDLVNESMMFVMNQQPLRIASEPMLEAMPEAKKNEPLRYTARIELLPQLDIKDYEGIEVTQRPPRVGDAQIDSALERKRQAHTEMVPIEGRQTAEATDTLTILLTGSLVHLTYDAKEMQVDLSNPAQSPLPGLAAALIGTALDAKDQPVTLTMPTEGLAKELSGKTGHFTVTVKAAHTKRLPDLDDDFAKDTGEADTLEALKAKIREGLETEDAEEAKHEVRIALVEELIKRNSVPLPPQLVGKLARNLLENPRGRMQLQVRIMQDRRKENPEATAEELYAQPSADQLAGAAHAEAVRNLSIEFVMMALADKEKVEVTEADVEKHLAELAKERDKSVARLKAELGREDEGLQQLRGQLRLEKALDLLESKANIKKEAATA